MIKTGKQGLCLLMTVCLALALAACVGANDAQPSEPADEVIVENHEGQNPVMNFIGDYGPGRPTVHVECEGAEGAKFTVYWSSSAWENSEWTMSGKLDPETLCVEYTDAARTDRVYRDGGELESETLAYENGTGRFRFDPANNTLIWEDDMEHMADGLVLEWNPVMQEIEAEQGDPMAYASVTAMDKDAVEAFCAEIREAYLNEDWETIALWIRYPISVCAVELNTAEEFLAFMKDKQIHEDDRGAMLAESCRDMFVNGEGICLGAGEVWICDPNVMTDAVPELKIIALSGIVNK